jgi:hypothetical protein
MSSGVENTIRKHMEALHDDLAVLLGEENAARPADRTWLDGADFAYDVVEEINAARMKLEEYEDWYGENVRSK